MKIEYEGKEYEVSAGLRIGRAIFDNDLIVPSEYTSVSRHHAIFQMKEGEVYIIDTESTFGIFVDEEKVDIKHKLQPGDKIRLGVAPTALEIMVVKENEK